jgi:hypothetical protein
MDKQQSDPSSRAHAKLSASQTKRWMTCSGSTLLIDNLPPLFRSPQSEFAALGTAAHSLVEECINLGQANCRTYKGYWVSRDGSIHRSKRDPNAFEVDFDMMDAVDTMLRVVREEAERLGPSAEMRNEFKFDLSWLRPDMFGTNDVSISLFLDELVVIDYKHGQGVPVEVSYKDEDTQKVVGNSQLMYYALGAAHRYDFTHEKITLIIVQPRCPHPHGGVRRFTCSMQELLEFKDKLAVAADRVYEANDSYGAMQTQPWELKYLKAGDHCKSSFCANLATCPALYRLAQEEAMADFAEDPPSTLLPISEGVEKLAQALKWVPVLDARNKAINELAQRLAEQGVKVPGQKLVRKKANRTWTCTDHEVITLLNKHGLSDADIMSKPELKSPAQIEKISASAKLHVNGVKAKGSESWEVAPLAVKGVGGLTLAPDSDPRTEVVVDTTADFPEYDPLSEEPNEGDL